jgi:hypothetical protein
MAASALLSRGQAHWALEVSDKRPHRWCPHRMWVALDIEEENASPFLAGEMVRWQERSSGEDGRVKWTYGFIRGARVCEGRTCSKV